MSKYKFVRVRISILKSKIMFDTWRPLKADPGGQPGTGSEVTFRHAFMYFNVMPVRISIIMSKTMFGI